MCWTRLAELLKREWIQAVWARTKVITKWFDRGRHYLCENMLGHTLLTIKATLHGSTRNHTGSKGKVMESGVGFKRIEVGPGEPRRINARQETGAFCWLF